MEDEQQVGPGDDRDEDRRPDEAPDTVAQGVQPKPRGQRRVYEKAERNRLAEWDLMTHVDVDDAISVKVAEGNNSELLGQAQADAHWLADAIKRASNLIASLGNAQPFLGQVAFGNSVTLYFKPSPAEIADAERVLREADAATDRETREALIAKAIPPTLVGGYMAAEFIERATDDPLGAALEYGSEVAEAWEQFAKQVARDDVVLEITPPGGPDLAPTGVIGSEQAARVVRAFEEEGQQRTATVTAFGTLTLADADKGIVGLKLDPEAARDRALKGKSMLRCEVPSQVLDSIRDQGLWNKDVRARVRITVETSEDGRTLPKPPAYTLLSVEPRYE